MAAAEDADQVRALIGDEILMDLDNPDQHVAELIERDRSGDMTLEIEVNGKI